MKLGRNDPCWCGSGKKYKKCHLDRHKEVPPAAHQVTNLFNSASQRMCLHPEASPQVCTAVINAHTVQRARVLGAIIDDTNHVLSFHSRYGKLGKEGPFRVGWRNASTITGFCSHHDSTTYSALEAVPFTATPQQCFLHMHRSICHELFAKLSALDASSAMVQTLDRGASQEKQQSIQSVLATHVLGLQHGVEDLRRTKSRLDAALLSRDYSVVRSVAFSFRGALNVAASGAFTPDLDIDGRRLQSLSDLSSSIEGMTASSEVLSDGCSLVLCWLADQTAPRLFVESLLRLDAARLGAFLPQLLFLHLENTYFSSVWWSSLTREAQEAVRRQAGNPNPYYSGRTLIDTNVTGWILRRIEQVDAV
jgi:hypothetical protein